MFEQKTVFVIGAGASREVGMPLGEELKGKISEFLRWDRSYSGGFREMCERYVSQPNQYRDAALSITRGLPHAISIDNFLHTHAENEEIKTVGKMAIVKCILESESVSLLSQFKYSNTDTINPHDLPDFSKFWCEAFFKMANEFVSSDDVADIFSNVSMIVFNYDRCIEFYIWKALQRYFLISEIDSLNIVKSMNIVHVYGSVGDIVGNWGGDTRFGLDLDFHSLQKRSLEVKTFTEQKDSRKSQEIQSILKKSEVIVFLGFSFMEINLKILEIDTSSSARVYGTSYGISDQNQIFIKRKLCELLKLSSNPIVSLENEKCGNFLENYRSPILHG
ncbi:Uncharacterised protein [Pannonibacter phragmitetus]|uniref:SIR2-like domain-containing protein n=1 Tax=Pannonibacter phragmitetus TaxID=121719 RepID=A0A379A167_9HYPH|nr:hypothetical protein [Pannonibacter phragmitetus]SUB02551.1 Uncharacterised protein [Pannonibacter phragmitetus]